MKLDLGGHRGKTFTISAAPVPVKLAKPGYVYTTARCVELPPWPAWAGAARAAVGKHARGFNIPRDIYPDLRAFARVLCATRPGSCVKIPAGIHEYLALWVAHGDMDMTFYVKAEAAGSFSLDR